MLFTNDPFKLSPDRMLIAEAYRVDEASHLRLLMSTLLMTSELKKRIAERASELVLQIRQQRLSRGGIDALLCEYDLSSDEGIALMCLAEALLRIPDKTTIDRLIRDKLVNVDWESHRGRSDSFFVNAATWTLMLTGKILTRDETAQKTGKIRALFSRFVARSSEPIIRQAVGQAVKVLSRQFVMGQTIEEALQRAKNLEKQGYRFSYDMLGEAARTAEDAENYLNAYRQALDAIKRQVPVKNVVENPGISVKLSALHPRYEYAKRERVMEELVPKLFSLAMQAKEIGVGLTIDAEEADRLDLSLDVIEAVFTDPGLAGWDGFGIAVQSYQKRAWYLIDWLAHLAKQQKRRFMIRLIKGAYWDSEIKMTQERGLSGYPVFTRKTATDISFLACAKKIISYGDLFYKQFATHNAQTVSSILEMMEGRTDFEFQCLHGMGYTLYDQIVGAMQWDVPCRVYAPVGGHEQLLSYLVRRLLENGANSSFVNRIVDAETPVETLTEDPIEKMKRYAVIPHTAIPLPVNLFGEARKNSSGIDLSDPLVLRQLKEALDKSVEKPWQAASIIGGEEHLRDEAKVVYAPQDQRIAIGKVSQITSTQITEAISRADAAFEVWNKTPVEKRAAYLFAAADLFEKHQADFIALLNREGGKTIPDAISEVREAVDYCRYYAAEAKRLFSKPKDLPGPTGESNQLFLSGRGVMGCISPWNFPLAIFIGQVVASLACGNTVLAKPAAQTPLVAALAVRLLHVAGIPDDVLHLIIGRGSLVGEIFVNDERIKGIVFTGSTETAKTIARGLAAREGAIVPLIAETGGQNVMIVDSSALPEQVVQDVITSAFNSAGQRCSALRVLFLQSDIADKIIHMLKGAMDEIEIGDPGLLQTDVGPVIDFAARDKLMQHVSRMMQEAVLIKAVDLPAGVTAGSFIAPHAFEIQSLSQLTEEVFGPILHIIRYHRDELDHVCASVNQTGYGLTLGIHSRVAETVDDICHRVQVGNIYVNRNMVGAVVGVQPFGGEGLSGTGPKAGGPHYLLRLCTERTLCVNTTASGGNASLMSLEDH